MATKQEIFDTTSAAVNALCKQYNVNPKIVAELSTILSDNLAPKSGGASVNIEDVTKSVDGKITEIQCSVSGKFLPATIDFFYEDKTGKGIAAVDGATHLKRLSRQAESIRKSTIKVLAATEKAIMTDVLDGKMTPEAGKTQLAKAKAKAGKPDYSSVSAELPKEDTE